MNEKSLTTLTLEIMTLLQTNDNVIGLSCAKDGNSILAVAKTRVGKKFNVKYTKSSSSSADVPRRRKE